MLFLFMLNFSQFNKLKCTSTFGYCTYEYTANRKSSTIQVHLAIAFYSIKPSRGLENFFRNFYKYCRSKIQCEFSVIYA